MTGTIIAALPVGADNSGSAVLRGGRVPVGRVMDRVDAVSRSWGMVFSLAYWSMCRLLELLVLRRRTEREKEIEILLLRHQLRVLGASGRSSAADAG